MKSRLMRATVALLLVALVSGVSATELFHQNIGTNGDGIPNLGLRDITIWCQPPDLVNWAKLASQIDVVYPFDAGTADDFMSNTDAAITHIQWWGGQWNYAGYGVNPPSCGPDFFVITFYTFDGTCFPPDPAPVAPSYLPNNYYYQELVYSWGEIILDGPLSLHEYSADIGPVLMNAGQTYWVEIQAVMQFGLCGQWGWLNSTEPNWNCSLARGFPLLGSPYWYSDIDYPSVAFCLYSDQSVPTEPSTWGGVKGLYR